MFHHHPSKFRTGGVYIAVLGTALIISVLGMSTLMLQRLQNRQLTATTDIRQAQLNAEAAVEIAFLAIQTESNWRTARTNGRWFTARNTGSGHCTADVIDPLDNNLADDDTEPVVILGIGNSGPAEQRLQVTVDPRKMPLECLRSTVAAGDLIDMQSDTLRSSGLITANQISANASSIYGNVEAVTVSGSTYYGTTTQVDADERPELPDWQSVFDYYRTNGTQINIGDLPTVTPNLGKNTGIENGTTDWSGNLPLIGSSQISQSNNFKHGGTYSLRVQNRDYWFSGAAQYIDGFVKSGAQYNIEVWVFQNSGGARNFHISLYVKGSGNGLPLISSGTVTSVPNGSSNADWTKLTATLTAQAWSGSFEYAFVKIGGSDSTSDDEFYLDDLVIRENTAGRFIYRQVLGPGYNPFGSGTVNSQGIYWIDCQNNRLIIERSRILGTLLVINPGANSCIGDGPIHWSPYVGGYPALLVDADTAANADFMIRATNRALNEKENSVNFNPSVAPHAEFGQDSDTNDIYRSEINGLIVVEDDLVFENTPLVRGQIIVGDDLANSSGTFDVEYQPTSLLNPPPGFTAPNSYVRRTDSAIKVVLP
jgi:hypothetical protein